MLWFSAPQLILERKISRTHVHTHTHRQTLIHNNTLSSNVCILKRTYQSNILNRINVIAHEFLRIFPPIASTWTATKPKQQGCCCNCCCCDATTKALALYSSWALLSHLAKRPFACAGAAATHILQGVHIPMEAFAKRKVENFESEERSAQNGAGMSASLPSL